MADITKVDITPATFEQDVEAVRQLWIQYWDALQLPADFQGFTEERRSLPGVYAPPDGRLLLARVDGQPAATAALRRLVEEARAAGYEEMYGDTLPSMRPALRLYNQIGFVEVGPYSAKPTPDAIFLKLIL